jgi:hypothetical protein
VLIIFRKIYIFIVLSLAENINPTQQRWQQAILANVFRKMAAETFVVEFLVDFHLYVQSVPIQCVLGTTSRDKVHQ